MVLLIIVYFIFIVMSCQFCLINSVLANGTVEIANTKDSLSQLETNGKSEESPYVANKGDFVAAPIPFSNPTIGSGLAGVLAYFYPQDDKQKNLSHLQ